MPNKKWLPLLIVFIVISLVAGYILSRYLRINQGLRSIFQEQGEITLSSDIPGYELTFRNKQDFVEELDYLGFWKEGGVGILKNNSQNIEWTTSKSLIILLTDDSEQSESGSFSKQYNRRISAYSFNVSPEGNSTLAIWVNPEDREDLDRFSNIVSGTMFQASYHITHRDYYGSTDSPYYGYIADLQNRYNTGNIELPVVMVEKN